MSIASSHILDSPQQEVQYGSDSESHSTQVIPVEDCCSFPEDCYAIVCSPGPKEYVELIEEQNREYGLPGEKLLHEAVDRIGRLAPFEVDGETHKLLDAAIEHQETGTCDDLEAWASRLADDVKDADD